MGWQVGYGVLVVQGVMPRQHSSQTKAFTSDKVYRILYSRYAANIYTYYC